MKTYNLVAEVTISVTATVRAKSKAAALKAARGIPMRGLCHSCARSADADDPEWVAEELDGEAQNVTAEESDDEDDEEE